MAETEQGTKGWPAAEWSDGNQWSSPQGQDEDRFSELPGDLIYQILFCLDMKSAAQTSILSRRLRYVWSNWTDIDLDPLKINPEHCVWSEESSEFSRTRYLNWVDQVINAHHGPSIDRLRISSPFSASYSSRIDAWLKFAFSKRVKQLELDLFIFEEDHYFRSYRLTLDMLKHSPFDSGIHFLTCLHLSNVDVSGEILEFILLQCPRLEQLSVFYSDLVSFKVGKCRLKRLALRCHHILQKVEVHADSLEYFEFYGEAKNMQLKSVPSLVEATFGVNFGLSTLFERIMCISEQLSVLTLDLLSFDVLADDYIPIPHFCNVKRLTLRLAGEPEYNGCLNFFTPIISACPVLCELKVEVFWSLPLDDEEEAAKASELLDIDGEAVRKDRESQIQGMVTFPNPRVLDWGGIQDMVTFPNLRILELVGFLGSEADVELLWFIAFRALNLKTIICDSHCYADGDCPLELHQFYSTPQWDMKETSRSRASKLAAGLRSLSPGLHIIIV